DRRDGRRGVATGALLHRAGAGAVSARPGLPGSDRVCGARQRFPRVVPGSLGEIAIVRSRLYLMGAQMDTPAPTITYGRCSCRIEVCPLCGSSTTIFELLERSSAVSVTKM